jgi:hypothetical protein
MQADTRRCNYLTEDFRTSRLCYNYCPVSILLNEAVTGVASGKGGVLRHGLPHYEKI